VNDFTIRLGPRPSVRVHSPGSETGWEVTLQDTGLTALTGARVRRAALGCGAPRFMLTYGMESRTWTSGRCTIFMSPSGG